jgi:allantoate deiminase
MMGDEARTLTARIEALAAISEEPGMLVRRSFTEEMGRADELLAGWMRDAGLVVRRDAVCNLIGRYECEIPGARTLILGSHLDSVRDAGRFDGPLGVTAALACVERLAREGRGLPFAVEVISFTDEEGLRFRTSYLGSSAVAGVFDPAWLEAVDEQGITMWAAMRAAGGDPDAIASCRYRPEDVLGYCEAHIEQGPVLEAAGLPVGVVTGIISRDRLTVGFGGTAGHAGTVPMAMRHDALCAAAEMVLEVERIGRETEGLVATVGQLDVSPGATNVIPGRTTLSLDVRHRSDEVRLAATQSLQERASAIAARRGVTLEWQIVQRGSAVPCAPALVEALERSIAALGYPVQRLASGAGHDAVPMSRLTQAAMIFVRCKDGVSHSPAESITAEDAGVAVEVLHRFVLDLAAD